MMNERIKLIAEQQGLTGPNCLISSQELIKFAELIIQECNRIADHWVDDHDDGVNYPSTDINQHFGIEEYIKEFCPRCGVEDGGTSCGIPDCGLINW